jgi:hypothetical protein
LLFASRAVDFTPFRSPQERMRQMTTLQAQVQQPTQPPPSPAAASPVASPPRSLKLDNSKACDVTTPAPVAVEGGQSSSSLFIVPNNHQISSNNSLQLRLIHLQRNLASPLTLHVRPRNCCSLLMLLWLRFAPLLSSVLLPQALSSPPSPLSSVPNSCP